MEGGGTFPSPTNTALPQLSFPIISPSVLASPLPHLTNTPTVSVVHSMSPLSSAPTELNDIWTSIQSQKAKESETAAADEPYVHPLLKRSSSLMSQKSLEVCTESLGSETGSDGYFSDIDPIHPNPQEHDTDVVNELEHTGANYHCSTGRSPPRRSFPPPLPSLSSRDRPCLQMRPRREDGRLVVEAVAVPSQNYLRAERQGGRLLLSFINTARESVDVYEDQDDDEEEEEEEEEEEVEVVDRGTVVEVKVHRSSVVINKFVGCTPASIDQSSNNSIGRGAGPRRSTTSSTTAAAVAASTLGAFAGEGERAREDDGKMLFTTKRRNREELLGDMRRCSRLRKPLFIWEPCCIATSSS